MDGSAGEEDPVSRTERIEIDVQGRRSVGDVSDNDVVDSQAKSVLRNRNTPSQADIFLAHYGRKPNYVNLSFSSFRQTIQPIELIILSK